MKTWTPTWRPGTSSSTSSAASLPGRPDERADDPGDERAEAVLLILSALAVLVAVALRQGDPQVGFSLDAAVRAIAGQLGATLPAAILVTVGGLADVTAGAVLLHMLRRRPFGSWSDLLLGGFAGAILLDCLLVFSLAGLGLFRQPIVAAVLAVLIGLGWLTRPIVVFGPRAPVAQPGVMPGQRDIARWVLVGLVWCGALIVALASPVVPAGDVLPNHVAPAEHLRVFGSIASLATYPSPIYGASRLFLGYSALIGTLSTLTAQPAALTVAAFTASLVALSAVAIRRLASAAFGPEAAFWALIAFPLSFTFVRLPDVRDSVVAVPLAAFALALMVRSDGARDDGGRRTVRAAGEALRPALRPDWLLAATLTGATLIHPLVGALTVGSVVVLTIADPARHVRRVVPALGATAIACLPQLAVMVGLTPAPAWGIVAFGGGGVVAIVLASVVDRPGWPAVSARTATSATLVIGAVAVGLVAVGAPGALAQAAQSFNPAFPMLFGAAVVVAAGVIPGTRPGRRLLIAPLAVGAVALVLVALIPGSTILAQSLRYEVPKAVGYWMPWACVPATAGLVAAAARWNGPQAVRLVLLGAFLAVVLIPFGPPQPDSAQASHPVADVLAQDLHTAEQGYWQGYPDARLVVDASGTEVLDFLRGEIDAGRLEAETRLLHVAASYQESASLPIGVFTGIEETMVSADATTNIFTAGGRIHPLGDLPAALGEGFGYVVLEPAGLPSGVRAAIVAAGYRSVFVNSTAEVFAASR